MLGGDRELLCADNVSVVKGLVILVMQNLWTRNKNNGRVSVVKGLVILVMRWRSKRGRKAPLVSVVKGLVILVMPTTITSSSAVSMRFSC